MPPADALSARRFRRPLLATAAFAGLRVGELLSLTWGDVNLATGTIWVRASKTDAGVRSVDVHPELRDELAAWKVSTRHAEPGHLVFPTSTGRPDNRNNVRRRVLVRAVERRTSGSPRRAAANRYPKACRRTRCAAPTRPGSSPRARILPT